MAARFETDTKANEGELAITLALPQALTAASALLVCVPGGGANRHYFDMRDGEDDRFSFARALTAHGHVVAMIDPPGTGESPPPIDPIELTVAAQLPYLARAIERLRISAPEGVDLSGLPVIGVGHSAGAMVAGALQAHHRCCEAMILLCFGTMGLPQFLKQDWLEAVDRDREDAYRRIPEFARARFGEAYFESTPNIRKGAPARALAPALGPSLAPLALQALTPGNVAAELALLDLPVFSAVGEHDIVGRPQLLPAAYERCPDFTQIVVKAAGHHVFLVDEAPALFGRIAHWLERLADSKKDDGRKS